MSTPITIEQAKQLIPQITESEGLFFSAPTGAMVITSDPNGSFKKEWCGYREGSGHLTFVSDVERQLDVLGKCVGDIFWYNTDEGITHAPIGDEFEVFEDYDAPLLYEEEAEEEFDDEEGDEDAVPMMAHVDAIMKREGLRYDLVEDKTIIVYLEDDDDLEITLTDSGHEDLRSVLKQLSQWISCLDDDYYDETRNLADPYDDLSW